MKEIEDWNPEHEDDDDKDECLRLLLGGISSCDISTSAWELESEASDEHDSSSPQPSAVGLPMRPSKTDVLTTREHLRSIAFVPPEQTGEFDAPWFSLAYKSSGCCTPTGVVVERPSVRVVDLAAQGRGNALIATKRIAAGDVIYTERAAVATQVPQVNGSVPVIRACQYCFRSLEPASSCQLSEECTLPLAHLWPVPDIEFDEERHETAVADEMGFNAEEPVQTRCDKYGRVQCLACGSWFCNKHCHVAFESQHGPCCLVATAIRELPNLLRRQRCSFPNLQLDDDDDDDDWDAIQPAIPLSIRMFATTLRHYRETGSGTTFLDGLCGESSDVTALELGVAHRDDEHTGLVSYSLEAVYSYLVKIWSVSMEEKMTFTLEFFMRLAASAARNGFGIRTQSPFKPYYAALLRTCVGGRGSEQHEELKGRVARALGSHDGNLERGMDRNIEAKVCPEIVALFPLTARINHACGSAAKAEVRSQEFVDHHIDLVALQDIVVGEEVTISYIHSGRKSRERRQRELRAKYLFQCDCQCCRTG
jgi:SET domain